MRCSIRTDERPPKGLYRLIAGCSRDKDGEPEHSVHSHVLPYRLLSPEDAVAPCRTYSQVGTQTRSVSTRTVTSVKGSNTLGARWRC